ncbi:hypothetical protein [Synechococcus sp. MIT S1220]|uniref:hypothetical protein n=1 Tax=Synechococcus sp. MIT S1220 TaxID=3082549 RepID=UPI0039AF513A
MHTLWCPRKKKKPSGDLVNIMCFPFQREWAKDWKQDAISTDEAISENKND